MRLFHLGRKAKADILIFDIIGAGWIHQCLPVNCTSVTVNFRHGFPFFLSFKFFQGAVNALLRYSPIEPAWLSTIIFSGIVEHLSPRIIVSCADNNLMLARFAEINSKIKVVLVQNALRDTVGSITPGQALPTYLAFGLAEKKIFTRLGVSCESYLPIGSVKLGLALSTERQINHYSSDIAFISNYRPDMAKQGRTQVERLLERNQKWLFSSCVDYVQSTDSEIAVIIKSRNHTDQIAERHYFMNLANQERLHFVTPDKASKELDSYFAGLSSAMVIHSGSTLGFELFGAGKKVFLGATADPELVNGWGISEYLNILPDFVKMTPNREMIDFRSLVDHILAMSMDEYLEITREARAALMSIPADVAPNIKVRTTIEHLLKGA